MPLRTQDEIKIGQLTIRFLVDGEASGTGVSIFEFYVPVAAKVPMGHSHDAYEETIYGLQGVLTFTIEGIPTDIGPGEVLSIRRGVAHRFDNTHDVDAKALAIISPGILGPDFFREMGAIVETAAGGPPNIAAIAAVMQRHGLTPAP